MTEKRKYDATVARMAGNIAPSLLGLFDLQGIARYAVELARGIVAEVQRTEPQPERKEPQ